MDNIKDITKRLKDRRVELGLSYQDIANITGVSKSTIQRYETGSIRKLPVSQLEKMAHALSVSPAYLMGWADRPPQTVSPKIPGLLQKLKDDPQLAEIVLGLAGLTPESRQEVAVFIQFLKDKEKKSV